MNSELLCKNFINIQPWRTWWRPVRPGSSGNHSGRRVLWVEPQYGGHLRSPPRQCYPSGRAQSGGPAQSQPGRESCSRSAQWCQPEEGDMVVGWFKHNLLANGIQDNAYVTTFSRVVDYFRAFMLNQWCQLPFPFLTRPVSVCILFM